jgi:hypothetical protein
VILNDSVGAGMTRSSFIQNLSWSTWWAASTGSNLWTQNPEPISLGLSKHVIET